MPRLYCKRVLKVLVDVKSHVNWSKLAKKGLAPKIEVIKIFLSELYVKEGAHINKAPLLICKS